MDKTGDGGKYQPQAAGGWGFKQVLPITSPLNVNTVDQDVYALGSDGPSILNNGIVRDGGVTELYENISTAPSGTYAQYVASNGKIISLVSDVSNSACDIYVSNTIGGSSTLLGKTAQSHINRRSIQSSYLDAVMSSDNTVLTLRFDDADQGIYLGEFDVSTGAFIRETILITVAGILTVKINAAICEASTLTFASVQSTSGIVYYYTQGLVRFVVNGTAYQFTGTNPGINTENFYIRAMYNAGRVIVFTPAGEMWANNTAGIYTTNLWSLQTNGGITGKCGYPFFTNAPILSIVVSTASKTLTTFMVMVSAAGAISYFSGYGTPNVAGFSMEQGVLLPDMACGCYTATGPIYGYFKSGLGSGQLRNTTTSLPPSGPALAGWTVLDRDPAFIPPSTWYHLSIKSYLGNICIMNIVDSNYTHQYQLPDDSMDAGAPINDFGGGLYDFDIPAGNHYGTGPSISLFKHPSSRYDITNSRLSLVYRLNNKTVAIASVTVASGAVFNEIAPGVVSINAATARNTIIDTNTNTLYSNYSTTVSDFFTTYTSTTASMCFFKKFNKYTSSLDSGLINMDPVAPTYSSGGYIESVGGNIYTVSSSAPGSYAGSYYGTMTGTPNVVSNEPINQGSYFFNPNVPVACDSIFLGGGILMQYVSAIQSDGVYGYQLFPPTGNSNLINKAAEAFFYFYGSYYMYDGSYIYQCLLTNGSTGTLTSPPIKVCNALGLAFLCQSQSAAYFYSDFDNSIYMFTGGRSLVKYMQLNKKSAIQQAIYSSRDNALCLRLESSVIVVRPENMEETSNGAFVTGTQITETAWPEYAIATYKNMASTHNGPFLQYYDSSMARYKIAQWNYSSTGTIKPLFWRSAHFSPNNAATMQVQRLYGTIYCGSNVNGDFTMTWYYILPDGTSGHESTAIDATNRNADGYLRWSWTPPHSYVGGGSLQIAHGLYPNPSLYPSPTLYPGSGMEQKIVILECLLYYGNQDAEMTPLTQAAV